MNCIGLTFCSRTASWLVAVVLLGLVLLPHASWSQEQVSLRFQGASGRGVSVTRTDIALVDTLFSFQGDEIVSAVGDFAAAGFTSGMVVSLTGSVASDGLYHVATVTAGKLILSPADHLSDENLSGTAVTISAAWVPRVQVPALLPADSRQAIRATAALDVPVSGSGGSGRVAPTLADLLFIDGGVATQDVVRTLAGDFRALDFAEGTTFAVRGSAANDGLYDVAEVREEVRGSGQFNEMVLGVSSELTNEGTTGAPTAATLLTAAPGFTAEAWVRFAEHAAGEFPAKWEAVMGKGRAWAISRYSNTDRITFSTWTGSEYHDVVSAADLAPGLWHHVAAVYDGSTKSLYVDGELAAAAAWSGPLLCDENPLLLGNAPVVTGDARLKEGRGLDGWLDVCRLWALPRSQGEVVATMQRRLRGSETGLLGAWRFDEAASRTAVAAFDSSARGNDGALKDLDPEASRIHGYDTAFEPPISLAIVLGSALTGNYALQLNGLDQFVMVQNEVIFDFAEGFALELWVNLDHLPTAGTAALISKGADAYELGISAIGLPYVTVAGLPGALFGLTALAPGDWHHLAAVVELNPTSGQWDLILMLDGAIDNAAYGLTGTPTVNDLPLCFGARPTLGPGSEAYFPGLIDDVRAWAVALAPERIAQNMTRTLTGREPGLAGWWPLDEGDGVVAADMKTVMTDPDSLVTLQFEQLAFPGNEIKRYASVYREDSLDPLIDPEGARDDAFVVSNSSVAPDCFAVKGEGMPDYPGSTALYNTIPLANTLLSMDANKPFRILSIDLGDLHQDASPGTQVTFQTTIAGTVVERTFSLDGGGTTPETFTFQRFNAVTELSWKQMPGYHLFDNIVLQDLDSLAPWHLKADGLLINLEDWARVDSPLLFTDPVDAQYALRFDGNGDWVEVPLPSGTPSEYFAMQGTGTAPTPFTLEAWIRPQSLFVGTAPDNVNPFETLIRQGDVGWGLAVDAAGFLRYWIADDPDSSLASDRPLQTGVWQHVAVVVNPASNSISFIINGAPAGDHEVAIVSVDAINPGLALGADSTVSPAGWLHADLDEIRIWDYARDPDEIYAFANRPLPDGMSGLLAYWRLNDGLGATAEDISGNAIAALLRDGTTTFDYPEWIYGPAGPNRDGMWALQFDGIDDYLVTADSLAFNPKADTILGSVGALGLQPGQAITIAETTLNNKDLVVEIARDDRLTVRPADTGLDPLTALANEGPVTALFTWNRLLRDALVFQHHAAGPDQIVSFSGSFTPLALAAGDTIVVQDCLNAGEYVIADVQPMVLTLDPGVTLTQDGSMTTADPALPVTLTSATLFHGLRVGGLLFVDNDTRPAELTVEAWIRPEAASTVDTGEVERRRTIVMHEQEGWGLALDADGFPVLLMPQLVAAELKSMPAARAALPAAAFEDGVWQHIAVTIDAAANTVVFYRNGLPVETAYPTVSLDPATPGDLFTGRQGLGTGASPARHHYKGALDELRLWTVVRTAEQIAQTAMRQLFHGDATLAAYWSFNRFDPEALNTFNAEVNFLEIADESGNGNTTDIGPGVMSVSAYIPGLYDLAWDGDYWDVDADGGGLDLSRSTGSRGLWVGKVVLNAVSEVQTASSTSLGQVTPTADTISYTILLHVDTLGRARLLKSVILMQAEGAATEEPLPEDAGINSDPLTPIGQDPVVTDDTHVALVTDEQRLSAIVTAAGARPQRISAPAYDFEGNELPLQGGIGPGKAVTGTIVLPRLHPTNPFRHKYHPDHRNVNPDNPDYGFEIVRDLTLSFDPTDDGLAVPGGYGVQRLSGTYEEQIHGLHKMPIVATGIIELQRVSTVGTLNE